jgi:hypothetical protein
MEPLCFSFVLALYISGGSEDRPPEKLWVLGAWFFEIVARVLTYRVGTESETCMLKCQVVERTQSIKL